MNRYKMIRLWDWFAPILIRDQVLISSFFMLCSLLGCLLILNLTWLGLVLVWSINGLHVCCTATYFTSPAAPLYSVSPPTRLGPWINKKGSAVRRESHGKHKGVTRPNLDTSDMAHYCTLHIKHWTLNIEHRTLNTIWWMQFNVNVLNNNVLLSITIPPLTLNHRS